MTHPRSTHHFVAAVAAVLSGCATPGAVPVKEQKDAGTLYFGYDSSVPDVPNQLLFGGSIDRSNSSSAWNGLLVPDQSAHVLLTVLRDVGEEVDRLHVSEDPNLIYQADLAFEFIPFTFEIAGNLDVWLATGDHFLFYCTVFNHAGAEFLAGDLLNESPARFRGVRADVNVQVTGLELCGEARGGLCATHEPQGGIPRIQIVATLADAGTEAGVHLDGDASE